jgi:SAM-dependent methyltransferase
MDKNLEEMFDAAPNAGFRARTTSEYRRIRGWTGKQIDFDTADILDFGCGDGESAASFGLRHPKAQVFGVDIEPVSRANLDKTLTQQIKQTAPPNVTFGTITDGTIPAGGQFNLIYAWSVFQNIRRSHFADIVADIRDRLKPEGILFIQSDPLYFSPKGSLLYNYIKAPWHHLQVSFNEIREAMITEKANETQMRDWQRFLELNRMSASEMIGTIRDGGFDVVRQETFKTNLVPPDALKEIYQEEVLLTVGVQATFIKR